MKKLIFILMSMFILNTGLLGAKKLPDVSVSHEKEETWTCPMHPQVKENKPGKCPICGMDLVKITNSHETKPGSKAPKGHSAVELAPDRIQKIGVKVDTVKKKSSLNQ
jgi:Cu(I)/Ag(I) efflux system membrane fusion protein